MKLLSDDTHTDQTVHWVRRFYKLPKGNNQLMIEAHIPREHQAGIILDDVIVQTCDYFGKTIL